MEALSANPPLLAACFVTAAPLLASRRSPPLTAPRHACRVPSRPHVRASAKRGDGPTPTSTSTPPTTRTPAPTPTPSSTPSLLPALPHAAQSLLLVNVVPFIWGTYTPVVKVITNINPHAPLIALNFISAAIGYATMRVIRWLPSDKAGGKHGGNREATPFRVSAELGVYLGIGATLHLAAFGATTPSRASFLVQLTSLFVPLIELLTGAKVSRGVLAAASLTVVGAAILAGPADILNAANTAEITTSFFSSVRPGDLLAVAASFFYSIQIIRTDMLAPKSGSPVNLSGGTLFAQSLVAGSFMLIASLFNQISWSSWLDEAQHLSTQDIIVSVVGLLWIGSVTNAFSLWTQILAQERVGASRAAIFFAAQPVWAVGLAVAAGLDTLTSSEIIGGAMIVFGGFMLAGAGDLEKT